jgi:hypothetical protein
VPRTADRLKPTPLFLPTIATNFLDQMEPSLPFGGVSPAHDSFERECPVLVGGAYRRKRQKYQKHVLPTGLEFSRCIRNNNVTTVEAKLQVQDGGSGVFSKLVGPQQADYAVFCAELFRRVFQPAPTIALLHPNSTRSL